MNFNDETKFKPLERFSGFSNKGASLKDLTYYEASEGYYVSCEGEIWSVKSGTPKKIGSLGKGYRECTIKLKKGKTKGTFEHRLVAEYWVEGFNPEEGKIIVNHIDENKTNNHPSNLEWCTHTHNINHGTGLERGKETRSTPERKAKTSQSHKDFWTKENRAKQSKSAKERWKNPEVREKVLQAVRRPVALFNSDGTVYKMFDSVKEASAYARVRSETIIDWAKRGKPSKCGKFRWDYYK